MADRWRDRVRLAEHHRVGRGTLGHLAVLAGSSAARTVVRRGTIALAIVGLALIALVVAVVALWPQITSVVRALPAVRLGSARDQALPSAPPNAAPAAGCRLVRVGGEDPRSY
jgi:hypothetical protein